MPLAKGLLTCGRLVGMVLALAAPATAQESANIRDCDWQASARNIVEPWADYSRTFSNGITRLALLDTGGEPAAGSYYLLMLSPPYGVLGDRQCRVIGNDGIGFGFLDFPALDASYDPAIGLTFVLPAEVFDGVGFENRVLTVTLNQATGAISARLSD
ncbi:MAG: hypothetical protein QNJ09_06725 [Paracoccaceae bacterium]|nr:hypothetical protein [Paracoccaceae bacterium]